MERDVAVFLPRPFAGAALRGVAPPPGLCVPPLVVFVAPLPLALPSLQRRLSMMGEV